MLQTTSSTMNPARIHAGPVATRSEEAKMLLHNARNAAYAEAAQGRLGEGLTLLQDALQQEPMSHDLMSDMAALLLAAGELEHAAAYAQHALEITPGHGASVYTLGFALAGLCETARAVEVLSRLNQGEARASLLGEAPELMPLVQVELLRLQGQSAAA